MGSKKRTARYELTFSVERGPFTEYTLVPYAVLLNEKGEHTLTQNRIYSHTASDFGLEPNEGTRGILETLEELEKPELEKKFVKDPGKNSLNKQWKSKKKRPVIQQYIEKRIARALEGIEEQDLPLFLGRDDHEKILHRRLHVTREKINAVFHFDRQPEGIRYHLTISRSGQEIDPKGRELIIITDHPGWIALDGELFRVDRSLTSKKFKPFSEKDHIIIPKSMEREYFRKFILKAVKYNRVEAKGFDIKEEEALPEAHLKVERDPMSGQYGFTPYFKYGEDWFHPSDERNKKVDIAFDKHEQVHMTRTKRKPKWEKEMLEELEPLGLKDRTGGFLVPEDLEEPEKATDDGFYDLIDWLKAHKKELRDLGFRTEALRIDNKKISTAAVRMEQKVRYDKDWFDVQAVVRIGNFSFPFTDLREHLLNDIREFRLPDGKIAILPKEWFAKYRSFFQFGKSTAGGLKIAKSQAGLLKTMDKLPRKVHEKVKEFTLEGNEGPIDAPEGFKAELRPYQMDGLNWMKRLRKHELGGCLADDMGLGKTVQTLALLLHIKQNEQHRKDPQKTLETSGEKSRGSGSLDLFEAYQAEMTNGEALDSLIVMPSSLVHNWEKEIHKFTPELTAYCHTGNRRARNTKEILGHDIILTTYSTLRNDIALFREMRFDYLILDESQFIKNPSSKTFKALKEVHAASKLVLTGTPIENSLSDLWSQMSVVSPGILGNYNFFRDHFIVPIEQKGDEKKREQLKRIISPFVKRRTKFEVAEDLPPLTEKVFYSEMTAEQKEVYEEEKNKARNTIFENIDKYGRKQATPMIISSLTKLRQISDHPVLCDENFQGGSGKFSDVLHHIESTTQEGHKILIFSQFVKNLELYRDHFKKADIPFSYLTGSSTNEERKENIERFRADTDTKLFLISLKAGGVGLNLSEADQVLLLDPWWNPATEKQAISRAHRIGQDKSVFAYKFITIDSVEEKILKLQRKKKDLAEDIIPEEGPIEYLSEEDLAELLE